MYMCPRCHTLMKYVMRFTDGKSYYLYKCPKCWRETRQIPLVFKEQTLTQKNRNIKNKKQNFKNNNQKFKNKETQKKENR